MVFNINQPLFPSQVFFPTFGANFGDFGTVAYTKRTTGIGLSNGSQGTVSFWYRPPTSSVIGTQYPTYLSAGTSGGYLNVGTTSGGAINIAVSDNISSFFVFTSSNSIISYDGVWRHIMASWDTNFSAGNKLSNLYVNGVNAVNSVTDSTPAFNIGYSDNNWAVSNKVTRTSAAYMDGDCSNLYFTPVYLDLSILANRRKFISDTKRPVFLGNNGNLPTGSQPAIYLKGNGTGFNINSGSGGDFTTTGTFSNSITTPSAP